MIAQKVNTVDSREQNYLVFIEKVKSKRKITWIFYCLISNTEKTCKNDSKITKMATFQHLNKKADLI